MILLIISSWEEINIIAASEGCHIKIGFQSLSVVVCVHDGCNSFPDRISSIYSHFNIIQHIAYHQYIPCKLVN